MSKAKAAVKKVVEAVKAKTPAKKAAEERAKAPKEKAPVAPVEPIDPVIVADPVKVAALEKTKELVNGHFDEIVTKLTKHANADGSMHRRLRNTLSILKEARREAEEFFKHA